MKNKAILTRIHWGCRAVVAALLVFLILLTQNFFAQPSSHPHYNPPEIVFQNGVRLYKTTPRVAGKTLRTVARDLNLNLDTLQRYNSHVGTSTIDTNDTLYYPVHLIDQDPTPPFPVTQKHKFTVISGDQVEVRESSIEDFRLSPGERFASIKLKDTLEKSDVLETIRYQGREIHLNKWRLPAVYYLRTEDGKQVQCTVDFYGEGILRFDLDSSIYKGEYRVSVNTTKRQILKDDGITLLFTSPSSAHFSPQEMNIVRTNEFYKLSISDDKFMNPIAINIHSQPDNKKYSDLVKKEPVIRIETKPRNLEGYGIEEISVLVRLLAYTGDDSLKIDIETTKGSVDPSGFYLSNKESKSFKIRSSGIGTAIVEVKSSEGYDSKVFKFNFPSMFLIFSLIGGLVGSLIKYLMKHKEYNLGITLLSGCLTGVFMTLLWWILGITPFVGLRLPSGVLNEGLVLLVAILGALYWEKAYSSLSKFLFLKKP